MNKMDLKKLGCILNSNGSGWSPVSDYDTSLQVL
jgi:hypothetical protein